MSEISATTLDALKGLSVLVVEDNGLLCCLLEEALLAAGCLVIGPYTRLTQALSEAPSQHIDVALLDINLRGELVSPLAAQLTERGIPFLLTSAYQAKDLPKSLQSATQLRKPFTDDDLYERLAELVTVSSRNN